jgi:hypothetical protein
MADIKPAKVKAPVMGEKGHPDGPPEKAWSQLKKDIVVADALLTEHALTIATPPLAPHGRTVSGVDQKTLTPEQKKRLHDDQKAASDQRRRAMAQNNW